MFAAIGVAFLILILVLAGIAGLVVYIVFYNRRLNKVVKEEMDGKSNRKSRPWPSPWIIVLTIACVILLIYSILTTMSLTKSTTYKDSDFAGWHYDGMDMVTSDQIEDSQYAYYASAIETGNIDGYDLETRTEGDFTYMRFKQNKFDFSGLKPQFLIFVKYNGDNKYFTVKSNLMEKNSTDGTMYVNSTCEWTDYVLFAGNLGDYASYELNIYNYADSDTRDADCENNSGDEEMFVDYSEVLTVEIK